MENREQRLFISDSDSQLQNENYEVININKINIKSTLKWHNYGQAFKEKIVRHVNFLMSCLLKDST